MGNLCSRCCCDCCCCCCCRRRQDNGEADQADGKTNEGFDEEAVYEDTRHLERSPSTGRAGSSEGGEDGGLVDAGAVSEAEQEVYLELEPPNIQSQTDFIPTGNTESTDDDPGYLPAAADVDKVGGKPSQCTKPPPISPKPKLDFIPGVSSPKQYQTEIVDDVTLVANREDPLLGESSKLDANKNTPGGGKLLRAIFDLEGSLEGDLSFKKDDMFKLLNKDGGWWEVVRLEDYSQRGFIPHNYVVEEESVESYDWFHGTTPRAAAVELLTHPANEPGTFLIRASGTKQDAFTISILADEPKNGRRDRHHRIFKDEQEGYFIEKGHKFINLVQLVEYYQTKGTKLHTQLQRSCPKTLPSRPDLSRATRDQWEIDKSALEFIARLGAGNFGEVWRGKWLGKTEVAIKKLKANTMSPQAFISEACVMKKLQHDHLVRLYAVCTNEEPILIVTEFMKHGSLRDYLRSETREPLDTSDLITMCFQVAQAMAYIEQENYIHRDLAARNVLVGANKVVKVADFGMARLIEDDEYQAQEGAKFPIKWTAPEAANYGRFTIKSDVWSYGILIVEIMSHGANPYPALTKTEVLEEIEKGYRHPKPHECPDHIYDVIMMRCWEYDPSKRPTFEELRKEMGELLTYQDA